MAEAIKATNCREISRDLEQVICVLHRGHSGDHRGVVWDDEGNASDYWWPRGGYIGRHRAPVPSQIMPEDVWHPSYRPKHREFMPAVTSA